jgi:hypothetical protein
MLENMRGHGIAKTSDSDSIQQAAPRRPNNVSLSDLRAIKGVGAVASIFVDDVGARGMIDIMDVIFSLPQEWTVKGPKLYSWRSRIDAYPKALDACCMMRARRIRERRPIHEPDRHLAINWPKGAGELENEAALGRITRCGEIGPRHIALYVADNFPIDFDLQ